MQRDRGRKFQRLIATAFVLASSIVMSGGANAKIVLNAIFTEAVGGVPGSDYFELGPGAFSPNVFVAKGDVSTTGAFGTTASAKSIADGPAGHIGAYGQGSAVKNAAGLVSIGGGSSGKITYQLLLEAGDSLLVRFSVHGSLVGDASMNAGIFDALNTSALNYGIACTPTFGCSGPSVKDFLIVANPTPRSVTPVHLTSSLGVSAGFGEALFSEANFYNSLDVALIAPAGTEFEDRFGVIQAAAVPEPGTFASFGIGLAASLAFLRQRQRARSSN